MFTTCQVKKNVTYIYIYIFGKTICWDLFFTENTSTLSSSRPLTRAMNSIKMMKMYVKKKVKPNIY